MADFSLPFVNPQRGRDGRVRHYYFRRTGRRWRLPGEPLSETFMAEYRRLLFETAPQAERAGRPALLPGSFGRLVHDYLNSKVEFGGKKPATQRMYRMILEPLAEMHGDKPVTLLERRHVKQWRDARSETPGMANMLVKVVRVVLAYAVDSEYRKDNPADRLKLFKLGEHRAWTEEECDKFEARWPAGTMQRRAYALAKYTGQRCGDLAKMTRAHRKDGIIRVVQLKTGAELWIPEHRALTAELGTGGDHMSLLTKTDGGGFDPNTLRNWFAHAIDEAGLPDDIVLHGLRKTAAAMLADGLCSAHEIAAITGHKSLKEIERYTKSANQKALASAAILKMERNEKGTASGKRPSRSSGKQRLTG